MEVYLFFLSVFYLNVNLNSFTSHSSSHCRSKSFFSQAKLNDPSNHINYIDFITSLPHLPLPPFPPPPPLPLYAAFGCKLNRKTSHILTQKPKRMINAERQTQYQKKKKKCRRREKKNTIIIIQKYKRKKRKNCCIFYELKSGQTDIKSDKNVFTSSTLSARCIELRLHCGDTL